MNGPDKIIKHGFVIVPPLSPWDAKNKALIWGDMAYPSFSPNEAGAWNRFIGPSHAASDDRSAIIQRFFDRGYRIRSAILEIMP